MTLLAPPDNPRLTLQQWQSPRPLIGRFPPLQLAYTAALVVVSCHAGTLARI